MLWLRPTILLLSLTEILAVQLLVSWSTSVKLVDELDPSIVTSLTPTTTGIIAVDYHYARGEIYYSDAKGRILRSWLRPTLPLAEPIVIAEVKLCDGLAVDWLHDRLYWTDITRRTLEAATLDGLHRKVLFNASVGLHKPRAMAIDPHEGIMFWSDWGDKPSLTSSGLDGKEMRTIMSTNLDWPNGLTLDLSEQKLYLLDGLRSTITSCNYDGSDRKIVVRSEETLKQAFGLSVYDKRLYWDSWRTHYVHSCSVLGGNVVTVHKRTGYRVATERLMGLKVVDPDLQRDHSQSDPCDHSNCSHFCLIGRGRSASCACYYGFQLQADGKTCQEEGYLLTSWTSTIRRFTVDGTEEEPLLDSALSATALDYHYSKQLVFWSENQAHRIYSSPLGQLNNKTEVAKVKMCDGLAVDWRHDILYWTDTELNTVDAAHLDGYEHRVIVFQDLDQPRALALDPIKGLMFWTDWGETPKIETALLDGSFRQKLVTHRVVWPNGLSLDLEAGRVYWVDGKLGSLEYVQYDGSGRQLLIESSSIMMQPFALSVLRDSVYWTEWTTKALYKANLNSLTHALMLANSTFVDQLRPLGMKVVHSSLQKQLDNPCLGLQCQGLCLGGTPERQHPRCLGTLVKHCNVESDAGNYELTWTAFNQSVKFSTQSSKTLSLIVIKVKCLQREGCSEDRRCSQASEWTEVFTNRSQFTISGLLPATKYNFEFLTERHSTNHIISTLESDPPEVPRVTSVEVRGRTALVKWNPVDTCVPHFQHYNYRLIKVRPGGGGVDSVVFEGSTNSTEATLQDLQPGKNYSIQVYTSAPQHFSHINFSSTSEEEEHCKADELACDGRRDCADGRDEAVDICARVKELVVYQKSLYAVFLRCEVVNTTRRGLKSFQGSYTNMNTNQTYEYHSEAEPCPLWPESFCFIISGLEPDNVYNFTVSAVLKSGAVGNELSVSTTTEEGASGPPENVTVVNYSATSVEFQWQHPRQSEGTVRGFFITVFELETFEMKKCCQEFPVIEQSINSEESVYSVEVGGLMPAATYAVSVVAKTVYTSIPHNLKVYTAPAPMDIVIQPKVLVSSVYPLSWQPRNILRAQNQFVTLITSYLLIVLPPPGAPRLNTSASVSEPLAAQLAKSLAQEFVVLWNKDKTDRGAWQQSVKVMGLTTGLQYQLVWAQVSQYKTVFQVDFVKSNKFIAI